MQPVLLERLGGMTAAQRQLACPIRFSQGLESPRHIGSALGAHSLEVLRELGYDEAQIAALQAAKALG